jgi:hypothetical protein
MVYVKFWTDRDTPFTRPMFENGMGGRGCCKHIFMVSEPSFLMCLAAECYWCAATTAVGQLGQPGAGGVASLVGRRRRSSGHGGGRVVDAPLLSTSSRYVLVLISYLKFRKLTCLDCSKKYFLKVVHLFCWVKIILV